MPYIQCTETCSILFKALLSLLLESHRFTLHTAQPTSSFATMAHFSGREYFVKHGLTNVSIEDLDHSDCCICLSTYLTEVTQDCGQKFDEPMRLICSHVIGSVCILRWTTVSNTCPICRHQLFQDNPSGSTKRNDEVSGYHSINDLDFPGVSFSWAQYIQFVEPEMIIDRQELNSGHCSTVTAPSPRVHHSGEEILVALWGLNNENHVQKILPYPSPLYGGTVFDNSNRYDVMLEKAIADSDILLRELQQFHESWMNESRV